MTDFSYERDKLLDIQREIKNLSSFSQSDNSTHAYLSPLLVRAMLIVHDVYLGDSDAEREIRDFASSLTQASQGAIPMALDTVENAIRAIRLKERSTSGMYAPAATPAPRTLESVASPQFASTSAPLRDPFISLARIDQLRRVPVHGLDPQRLVRLLEEINDADQNDNLITVSTLCRHVMNHVPPVFAKTNFDEVVSNYKGGSSFKAMMQTLQNSLKHIADGHAHIQMRSTESLPERQQVDFGPAMDKLLEEVVRLLKDRATVVSAPRFGIPSIGHVT